MLINIRQWTAWKSDTFKAKAKSLNDFKQVINLNAKSPTMIESY